LEPTNRYFIEYIDVLSNGNLASWSSDEGIKIWDLKSNNVINSIQISNVLCLLALPNETLAVGHFLDKQIKLFNVNTGVLVDRLSGHESYVKSLALLNSVNMASGSRQTIIIWDFMSGQVLRLLTSKQNIIHSNELFLMRTVGVLANRNLSSDADSSRRIFWNWKTGQLIGALNLQDEIKCLLFLKKSNYLATAFNFYPSYPIGLWQEFRRF
jgi:WD40 repeat protein